MTYALGYTSEQQYHDDCALDARNGQLAAIACNDILTLTQARVLRLAIDAMPEAAVVLAETAFEVYGWPDRDLDTAWLDEAGRATFDVFTLYSATGAA